MDKSAHLQMIQSVINRMASNSFMLKGWAIIIFAVIFDLKDNNIIFTNIPVIIFWLMDSYYLQLERKYRKLYDYVRTKDEKEIDYDMNVNNLNLSLKDSKSLCILNCIFSKTELFFYGTCIITSVSLFIYNILN